MPGVDQTSQRRQTPDLGQHPRRRRAGQPDPQGGLDRASRQPARVLRHPGRRARGARRVRRQHAELSRMDGLFDIGPPRRRPAWPRPARSRATPTPRRRWPCGCARARSTSSSASSTCWRPGSPLRRLVEGDQPMSLLLWGPPGTGKTTIASIVCRQTDRALRRAVGGRRRRQGGPRGHRRGPRPRSAAAGRETVLFVDEVHRFTKAQQDALLPRRREPLGHAGRGDHGEPVLLGHLAAAVAVAAAHPRAAHRRRRPRRRRAGALTDERGLGGAVDARADDALRPPGAARRRRRPPGADRPGGRGRGRAGPAASTEVDLATAETAVDRAAVRYDRRGRPALRRDQRVHQVDPRLRRRRGAALPGPDGRGGGGPAVHRPPAGHPRQRGHRAGRPDGAAPRRSPPPRRCS